MCVGSTKEIVTGAENPPCTGSLTLTCTSVRLNVVGAVYRPEGLMVPIEAEPPATSFTNHMRFATGAWLSAMLNCSVCPGKRIACDGLIAITGSDRPPPLHPEKTKMLPDSIIPRTRRRNAYPPGIKLNKRFIQRTGIGTPRVAGLLVHGL